MNHYKNKRKRYRAKALPPLRNTIATVLILLAVALIIGIAIRSHHEKVTNVTTSSVVSTSVSKSQLTSTTLETETTAPPVGQIPNQVKQAFLDAGADDSYAADHPYCIAVNTLLNEVIVYSRAEDGSFSQPYKAMVASCGKAESPTKTGTFKTVEKYEWRALNGGVFGQYATRIDGPYLFHSVPYYRQSPDSLETEEYNHLGENRSLGCVRLAVADCKWIYDNCPLGTIVTMYADASVTEPLPKPSPTQIPLTGDKAGWDPTDPNANNPWI